MFRAFSNVPAFSANVAPGITMSHLSVKGLESVSIRTVNLPPRDFLEGEGSMEIEGKRQIVRRHDVVFIPPGVSHSIRNDGLTDLTFIVVTTPVEDR